MTMKIAIITDEVSQDLDQVLAFAREFSLDGLEIRSLWNKLPHELTDEEAARIKEGAAEAGLAICGVATPVLKCDVEKDGEIPGQVDCLRKSLRRAEEWGAPMIRTFTGWRTKEPQKVFPRAVEVYREHLLPVIEGSSVFLGVENEFSTNVATGAESREFLSLLDSPRAKLVWDPCNILYLPDFSDPFEENFPAVRDLIGHVHVKDAVRTDGKKEAPAESVALGDGGARLLDNLKALHADGYRGWISLETHWRLQQQLDEGVTRSPKGESFSSGAEPASRECMKRLKQWLSELDGK